jgi:3D (Asp-Asp-Asp) domain-containing protein
MTMKRALTLGAVTLLLGAVTAPSIRAQQATGPVNASGGAPVGGLAPTGRPHGRLPHPGKGAHGSWIGGFTITEYWPAPERWFGGAPVQAPGLSGQHRIDWLYSALGVSMEGQGIGLDGQIYHIDSPGDGGWVTAAGTRTSATDGWSAGPPYWRAGAYWRNSRGGVTFPLASGGWSSGTGRQYVPLRNVSFKAGPALPLSYYQSIAVDPRVIPLGSRVYIPAYRNDGHGGWFVAQDTGGAIGGRHIDVYRPPPPSPTSPAQDLTRQRVLVIKPTR